MRTFCMLLQIAGEEIGQWEFLEWRSKVSVSKP